MKEKKWGEKERKRRPDQEVVNHSYHRAYDGSQKKTNSWDFKGQICGKNSRFCGNFAGKLGANFVVKQLLKKQQFHANFSFLGGGGEGMLSVSIVQ